MKHYHIYLYALVLGGLLHEASVPAAQTVNLVDQLDQQKKVTEPLKPLKQQDQAAPARPITLVPKTMPTQNVTPVSRRKRGRAPRRGRVPLELAAPSVPPKISEKPVAALEKAQPAQSGVLQLTPEEVAAEYARREKLASSASAQAAVTEMVPESRPKKHYPAYLGEYLDPWDYGDKKEHLELNFDNAELSNFISFIEKRFNLTFILDDAIKPTPPGGKPVLGTKISFTTHQPLTKKQTWDIFTVFLTMSGLAVAPEPGLPRTYRITAADNSKSPLSVNRGPLPTFIGVDPSLLPNDDTKIRYVYFVDSASLNVIKNVLDTMKSATAPNVITFEELRAVLITDRASNVLAMLKIISELDKVNMPEMLAVIKLKRTDAADVAKLYNTLIKEEAGQGGLAARLLGARKQPTSTYFPENLRVIPEPRTNSLILLGTRDGIKKVEDFIVKHVDKELDIPYSPLHIYQLEYVDAVSMATILNDVVQFGRGSPAATYGGVRDSDRYLRPDISITAEPNTNVLIIKANYEDYLDIYRTLKELDIEQPQVIIKVLILDVTLSDNRQFGVQLRDQVFDTNAIPPSINFQTSGLYGSTGVVENTAAGSTGATRLLGNLIDLASAAGVGSTLVTLGSDAFGVWGLLNVLESLASVSVVANPFLVTTHKTQATISVGETRRVLSATVFSATNTAQALTDLSALLKVTITPQVSPDGFVILDVAVTENQFNGTLSDPQQSGNRTERAIQSSVIVRNKEVIGLGGLTIDRVNDIESKVPILGDIPLVGWLFKNKARLVTRSSIVVLISPEIIPALDDRPIECYTKYRLDEINQTLCETHSPSEYRDPIHRWFFHDTTDRATSEISAFVAEKNRYLDPSIFERVMPRHPGEPGAPVPIIAPEAPEIPPVLAEPPVSPAVSRAAESVIEPVIEPIAASPGEYVVPGAPLDTLGMNIKEPLDALPVPAFAKTPSYGRRKHLVDFIDRPDA